MVYIIYILAGNQSQRCVNEIMRVVDEVIIIHVNKIAGATQIDASHNCSLLT